MMMVGLYLLTYDEEAGNHHYYRIIFSAAAVVKNATPQHWTIHHFWVPQIVVFLIGNVLPTTVCNHRANVTFFSLIFGCNETQLQIFFARKYKSASGSLSIFMRLVVVIYRSMDRSGLLSRLTRGVRCLARRRNVSRNLSLWRDRTLDD